MKRTILPRALGVILGGLFVYAGILKAWNPAAFAVDVSHYRIVPWSVSALVALYLPWLEIVCGSALIFRRASPAALGLLSTLMGVFVVATVAARLRGIDIACGCFGSGGKSAGFIEILARDGAILFGLGLLGYYSRAESLLPGSVASSGDGHHIGEGGSQRNSSNW